MNKLRLPRSVVNKILALAQHSPDTEICGLISGTANQAKNFYPITNNAHDPKRRYTMEPKAQIDAMRQIRETDEELLAIYHSHPQAPALPSKTDIIEANYPDTAHLIISLNTEGVLQMAAFNISDKSISPIELELI